MNPLESQNQALLAILNQQRQLQQAGASPTTQGLGIGIGQQAQGQMMGQDYRLLDEQTRGMAELQAQGAMIQPNMPTMPTMGKEEKGLLQLAKLFAIGSGIDPRAIAQEEQNYNQRRQQEIQLAHQNATQLALAQANQQMGANKADQYRLGAEGQITEGRVKRRESDMAAKAKLAQDELDHSQNLELARTRSATGSKMQAVQDLVRQGYSEDEAFEQIMRLSANQTKAKGDNIEADTGLKLSATAENEAQTKRIEALLPAEKARLEEIVKTSALKRKYLPDDYRIKWGMLQLQIDQLNSLNSYRDARLDLDFQKFDAATREQLETEARDGLADLAKERDSIKGKWRDAQVNVWSMLGVTSDEGMGKRLAELKALEKTDQDAYDLLRKAEQEIAKALIHHRALREAEDAYKEAEGAISKAQFDRETAAGRPPVQGPLRPGESRPKAPAPNRGNSSAQQLREWGDSLFGGSKIEQFSGKPRMTRGSSAAGGSPSKHNHGAALDVYHRTGGERQANIQKAIEGGATLIIDYQGKRTWRPGRGWKSDPKLSSAYNHIHVENDRPGPSANPKPAKAEPKKPEPKPSGNFWQDLANAPKKAAGKK